MYSPLIVDRRLAQLKKAGITAQRRRRDESIETSTRLQKLRLNDQGQELPEGQLVRELDAKEQEFIRSERAICKADFSYFLTRYYAVELDPGVSEDGVGGIAAGKLQESQEIFIKALGKREEVCHEEKKKYGHTAGILVYAHKCRQVIFTGTSRGATMHRMLFWPGTRCFAGSLNNKSIGELYKRDLIAIDNLPFWLKPKVYPNVKDEELGFEYPLSTRLNYQAENEAHGIGTGTQIDVSHLTEVPLWNYWPRVKFSFLPGLPKAITTLHIQEGTSAGKGGHWQEASEGCRKKQDGYEDWTYIFIPWWVNSRKYRGNPPDSWVPSEHTVKHAEFVERTSPEFNEGVVYRSTRDQMFWWEKTRALHSQSGELASFLANYPATPEQSFVNWAQGALPVELVEQMELDIRQPRVYEVMTQ